MASFSNQAKNRDFAIEIESSIRWLVNHMMTLGFSKSFSDWIGSNLKKSEKGETWAFNLKGAVGMFNSYRVGHEGRVTVAYVKNFQPVAAFDPSHNVSVTEQEKVILQFRKIGKDIFTMDYLYPLSAFQAFVLCLSSFDTKPACE